MSINAALFKTVAGEDALYIILRIAGALLLAYFMSRATLRLPNPSRRFRALLRAHALAFALSAAVIAIARFPLGVFSVRQLGILLAAQISWLSIDQLRRNYPENRRSVKQG
ncbi:hypothetical protein [Novosphingobium sp.]|uniref:hypothetical protein n=1 Tax=Novosphingobium sp. TaxID=1874826 RepID=UPI002734772C|nr:hypothetical protein [Novosphingobium sp.]MDP3906645.1 hypothetical protein [Novosphingobium sp.]